MTSLLQDYAVTLAGIFLVLVTVIPYVIYENRKSARVRGKIEEARQLGLNEPVTIHPKVNRSKCIGSGACIKACPEKSVLGLVDNKSRTVCASACVGHGACARACPVGAIELVFGSERRGVDIPQVYPNFETNVKRLYIAGELGGMGLIRNAVTQGQEAAAYIAEDLRERPFRETGVYDLLIVGAGPAGLSASLQAKKDGLKFLTIEREEELGGAILSYPRAKIVMTAPMTIPVYGKVKAREISKERLMNLWSDVAAKTGLKVEVNETVLSAVNGGDYFAVKTNRREIRCRYLLLCVGRRGSPRKLDVPGEKSAKVMYRLLEPERFEGAKSLVVGGGDSAVEAAMALAAQNGASVTLSYRGEAFARIKPKNRERLETAAKGPNLKVILNSIVTSIEPDKVNLMVAGKTLSMPNDYVFVFAGGIAPNEFLKSVGVSIETKYGTR